MGGLHIKVGRTGEAIVAQAAFLGLDVEYGGFALAGVGGGSSHCCIAACHSDDFCFAVLRKFGTGSLNIAVGLRA